MKRNVFLGFIVFVMLIGISMIGCGGGDGPNGPGGGNNNLSGTINITPNTDVTTGQTLTANYSGTETISYQWKRGSTNLGTNQTQLADQSGSYTVTVTAIGYNSKTSSAVNVTDPVGNLPDDYFQLYNNGNAYRIVRGAIAIINIAYIPSEYNGLPVTAIDEFAFSNSIYLNGVSIPESITSIGMGAFSGCTSLSSINIPESITSIEMWTFSNCTSLSSINIPSSVTSINSNTFSGCTSLSSINIPASVTTIGNRVFENCNSLASVTFEENSYISIYNYNAFPGNLVSVSGGVGARNRYGTYTTTNPGNDAIWVKQQ